MLIRRKSVLTGVEAVRDIHVDLEDFARFQLGEPIETAMPYLSEAHRVFITTGITEEELKAAFKDVIA